MYTNCCTRRRTFSNRKVRTKDSSEIPKSRNTARKPSVVAISAGWSTCAVDIEAYFGHSKTRYLKRCTVIGTKLKSALTVEVAGTVRFTGWKPTFRRGKCRGDVSSSGIGWFCYTKYSEPSPAAPHVITPNGRCHFLARTQSRLAQAFRHMRWCTNQAAAVS